MSTDLMKDLEKNIKYVEVLRYFAIKNVCSVFTCLE